VPTFASVSALRVLTRVFTTACPFLTGNLPHGASESRLMDFLKDLNISKSVIRVHHTSGKRFCFVQFKSFEDTVCTLAWGFRGVLHACVSGRAALMLPSMMTREWFNGCANSCARFGPRRFLRQRGCREVRSQWNIQRTPMRKGAAQEEEGRVQVWVVQVGGELGGR
jgi:hypothetical protein